ncbi:hypothetical protein JL721_12167 [Aureococcus anophagefferens]|nr:hypothetical protein JL721_12167 [Aureococcus anophagefferens]
MARPGGSERAPKKASAAKKPAATKPAAKKAAKPAARTAAALRRAYIGRTVKKAFYNHGKMEWYDGVVKSLYSKSKWFLIVYTDDDKEEVTEKELQRILVPPVPGALGAIAASSLLPAVGAYGGAAARDVEAYRRTDAENPLFFRPSATSVSYADLNDDGPAFLAGAAAGTRWARGDVLTRSRRRFRVAFGAVLGAGRAYVGLAVARAFDGGAATLDSDDAILISSHGYISRATGGGADGLPNRWGPGPDGWVDVQVDLDTHYVSIASCVDRNGHTSLSVHSLRRRLRKGEALVPVVGVVAGSDAQLLPLAGTDNPHHSQ